MFSSLEAMSSWRVSYSQAVKKGKVRAVLVKSGCLLGLSLPGVAPGNLYRNSSEQISNHRLNATPTPKNEENKAMSPL